ncbi:MipA/OmpV family protein [Undibacterium parvum]|uniref:MipA/OmpV family protein n=2 Tax=Undibacterium TaxID=401469 RepID=A0A6M4A4F7_9BURK|nr:MipA/OmpV family protein [Undibacterium parvum]QJQ05447.1 MipA/OmpV family protein [Undibacterium piscinae]
MTIPSHSISSVGRRTNLVSNTFRLLGTAVVTSLFLPCSLVLAQQTADNRYPDALPTSGIIGVGVASLPKYQGSDETETKGVAILEYHWANGIFVGGDNNTLIGLQYELPSKVQYGSALGIDVGRKESHSRALAGMGDVERKAVFVSFIRAAITDQFSINSSVQIGSGNEHKGALLKLGAAYAIPLNSSMQVSLNVDSTLANDSYMENYFGVSATQASTSRYRVYKASSGLRDVSVGVRLSYQINHDWSVLAAVSSTSLASAAKDSPLALQANTQQVLFGVTYNLK